MSTSKSLISAATRLRDAVNALTFSPPVTHVYNPLDYAWDCPGRGAARKSPKRSEGTSQSPLQAG